MVFGGVMTIKRLILVVLTIIAIAKLSLSLIESLGQPQIQSRLELYQTNLLLHASEWQGKNTKIPISQESAPNLKAARNALIGDEPIKTALEQYQEARESARESQSRIEAQLQKLSQKREVASLEPSPTKPQLQFPPVEDAPVPQEAKPPSQRQQQRQRVQQQQLQESRSQVKQLINELDLRIGILQAQQGGKKAAIATWNKVANPSKGAIASVSVPNGSLVQTAQVLIGLWSDPPRLLPNAESEIQKNLEGWFRYRALTQLYQLQQRQDTLLSLQAREQEMAEQAIIKLALVGGIPGFGGLVGVVLLIVLIAQRLLQGKRSLLALNNDIPWETPWNWEIIWQVFILGFFFIGQVLLPYFILPLSLGLLGLNPVSFTVRMKAFYVLASYLLMASGGLFVLYRSLKPYFPLPDDWFRFQWRSNWIVWGLGGYFVALPLVIVVSLINQKLWQGQGGSNPILPLALEGQDSVALLTFFITACVAAPMFEEIFFRGFLLPSLTRYMPVWGAIVASGLLFAIAHLSFSEVLPLATLGIVLGVVYARSRNLLASMLLHGLWNAGTLLSLFILGSGSN
jgi:membrane protease YdiL (CAAX protease family)